MTMSAWAVYVAAVCFVPGVLSSDATSAIDLALREPILASGTTRTELEAFIKKRIPELVCPASAGEWKRRDRELRRRLLDEVVFRGVPDDWLHAKLRVEWLDTIDRAPEYRIRKLRYEALPGLWIPALLYEPKNLAGKAPAILNVNGHVGEPGKTIEYEQVRCINLAVRGMLALHPEWLNCGELRAAGYEHNRSAYLDLCGVSGVSVFYQAMKRGLDVLLAHPAADSRRVAMTGLSGGGWQTIVLSALDTRIKLSAPNAGYITLAQRTENLHDVGDLEQVPTDFVSVADYAHLTAMLAPRPTLLIYNAKDECCFTAHRARQAVYEPTVAFYQLFGRTDRFAFHQNTDPGTHNYERDNREQFYRFVNRHFLPEGKRINAEIPCEDERLTFEELRVGIPEENATFFSLADAVMASLPPRDITAPREKRRERLHQCLRVKGASVTSEILIAEEVKAGLRLSKHILTVGGEWSVPVIVVADPAEALETTALVLCDDGKTKMTDTVAEVVQQGSRAVVLDPLLMGECNQLRDRSHQYAMMIGTVGERVLGLQVSQLAAVVDWARSRFGDGPVTLHATGWNAGVAALAARALHDAAVNKVTIREGLQRLGTLIERRIGYESCPALFCFGLLREFDIADFVEMCKPAAVDIQATDDPKP